MKNRVFLTQHRTLKLRPLKLNPNPNKDKATLPQPQNNRTQNTRMELYRTIIGVNHKQEVMSLMERTYATHLECAAAKVNIVREKLQGNYASSSKKFPVDTKMRLIPPFFLNSIHAQQEQILLLHCKTSCISFKHALLGNFPLISFLINQIPKQVYPVARFMMELKSKASLTSSLFHSIDKQWRSENTVVFTFLPENKPNARTVVFGFIPIIRDENKEWYLKLFTNKASLRHSSSKWDPETRQVYSAEENELANFLANNNRIILTNHQLTKPYTQK